MNSKNIPKLTLFFDGLGERTKENIDFFVGCDIIFKSGNKTFGGKITAQDNNFGLLYLGINKIGSFEELCSFIANESIKYDSIEFTYKERGANIIISADEKGVRSKQAESTEQNTNLNPLLSDREYFLKVGKADNLLKAIGIMTADGKIKNDMIRKYNQTDRFIELTADYFKDLGEKTITVLDCACGKSYLSFALNYYLVEVLKKKCRFIGIDISDRVIEESKRIAAELGYNNMEFFKEDLRGFEPKNNIDVVISLHACDTATDMALGLAIRKKAKAVLCVPCCHKELLDKFRLEPLAPIMRYGVFKTKLNDVFTDGLRCLKLESCGYKVSAIEYVSPLDTPKNLLIRGIKIADENEDAKDEYYRLCRILCVTPAIEAYSSDFDIDFN